MVDLPLTKKNAPKLILIIVLLVGFAFRLSYVHTRGFTVDLKLFVRWARLVSRAGLGAVYAQMPSAYPPLGTALLWPVGMMCSQCAINAAPVASELLVLRLLCTGFDLLNAAVLFRVGRKMGRIGAGLAAAGLCALSPTIALVSGWWAQNDSWFILFMLLAGVFLREKKPVWAWVSLALSILIKLQAVILLPVFVAGTWRWFGWKRLILSAGALLLVVGVSCIPVLIEGQWGNFVAAVTLPIRQDPFVQESHITMGGHNLWAGLALLKRLDIAGSYRQTIVPGITFYAASISLLLLSLALAAARVFISSGSQSAFVAITTTWIIFFQFAIGVGVRYLLPTTVFALLIALEYPLWWVLSAGFHFATLFSLQETIRHATYPFLWIPVPGSVETNIALIAVLSLVALGWFFTQTAPPHLWEGRSEANRLELVLTTVGLVTLVLFLATWLAQSANAQHQLEQQGLALNNSMRQQLQDATDALIINWPREISSTTAKTGFLSPSTGLLQSILEEMEAISATIVIYSPWVEAVDQVHHWEADYHGYHVTTEMLIERILNARRVLTINMLTDTPQIWRLAEIAYLETATAPVADFGQSVRLMNAQMEYQDHIVLVRLDWNVAQSLPDDITVFVHILSPDGDFIAQIDGDTVNNLIPLARWHLYSDIVLRETRVVALPQDAPSGIYTAVVGLYHRSTLERLEISCTDQHCADQAYMLTSIYTNE